MSEHLKVAFRRLIKQPGVSLVALITLAVGIGVSTAIFTVVNDVLLRPFPFTEQERLVLLWSSDVAGNIPKLELIFDDYEVIRKDAKTLSDVAAFSAANFSVTLKRQPEPLQLNANIVSERFFQVLGVQAAVGRTFTPREHQVGAPNTVVLSYKLWKTALGGDQNIVGTALTIDGQPVTVIGVLPEKFDFPSGADILVPVEPFFIPDVNARTNHVLAGVARLAPGATVEAAQSELAGIAKRLEQAIPEHHKGIGSVVLPMVDDILGSTKEALLIVMAMALLVLVIAWFNVGNILLTQGIARQKELALRGALGATPGTFFKQFFAEAIVLTGVATVAGLLVARLLISVLLRYAPSSIPRIFDVSISPPSYLFMGSTAILTSLFFAVISARQSIKPDLMHSLREGTDKSTITQRTRRLLNGLAVCQLAVAMILLVGAALMIRSFWSIEKIDLGFRRESVVTAELPLPPDRYPDAAKGRLFHQSLLERLNETPGIASAGNILMRPLEIELGWDMAYSVEGQDLAGHEKNPIGNYLSTSSRYFHSMGIKLLKGRTFSPDDKEGSPLVAVVSRSFAERFWTVDSAIGKRFKSGKPDSAKPWWTIVGVVDDVRYRGMMTEKLDVYENYLQSPWVPRYVVVRGSGESGPTVAAVRQAVRSQDPNVPVAAVRTTDDLINAKLAQPRLNAILVAVFAVVALFLSLVGIYGVLSYGVRQRTRELGVRLALGAGNRTLLGMVMRDAMRLSLLGIAAGAVGALIANRFLAALLYGVEPNDSRVMAITAAILILSALTASLIPALRASRLDPLVALRDE